MSAFEGAQLKKKDGCKVCATDTISHAKVVLVYFSAHWCPPCRGFTPKLKEFYDEMHKTVGDELCIIFVSSDRTDEDMMSYFTNDHGDYYAIDFKDSEVSKKLKENCNVSGIPMLCVVNKNGENVHGNGRGDVTGNSAAAAYGIFLEKSSH